MRRLLSVLCIAFMLLNCGCAAPAASGRTITVMFEDAAGCFFYKQIYDTRAGGDMTLPVGVPRGQRIVGVNHEPWSVSPKTGESQDYDYYDLTLYNVRYSTLLRLTLENTALTVYAPGSGAGETVTVTDAGPHLYRNALKYTGEFSRPGYIPVGWNTAPDGSGLGVGFGSRIRIDGDVTLYPDYLPCTPEERFTAVIEDGRAMIVGADPERGADLIIPETIGGCPVTEICAGAFDRVAADMVVLPPSLVQVEDGAFASLQAEKLYMFDGLTEVSEASFGDYSIRELHLQAVKDPVYSGTYFDGYTDKVDRLFSLYSSGEQKLVIFCGSSGRFGFVSPLLEQAFPDYRAVNLGTYAYANMAPQAEVLLSMLTPGDVVLHSPELDAISEQFMGSRTLDADTFRLMESCYDLLTLTDLSEYSGIFDAFSEYQRVRSRMTAKGYNESCFFYDEDGKRVEGPVYNIYGDYVLQRPDNTEGKLFGVKRACYEAAGVTEEDLAGLTRFYDRAADLGARVYFTWSPRSRASITPGSTGETMAALQALVKSTGVTVIDEIEDSLWDPLYFYGTDNHLSTAGAKAHTALVIEELKTVLGNAVPSDGSPGARAHEGTNSAVKEVVGP